MQRSNVRSANCKVFLSLLFCSISQNYSIQNGGPETQTKNEEHIIIEGATKAHKLH